LLISAYRRILRRPGFWLLLGSLLAVHVGLYALFLLNFVQGFRGLAGNMVYGALGGIEFLCFAIVIVKVYGVGPNTKYF
jgi:hypothetical protein